MSPRLKKDYVPHTLLNMRIPVSELYRLMEIAKKKGYTCSRKKGHSTLAREILIDWMNRYDYELGSPNEKEGTFITKERMADLLGRNDI